MRFLRFAAVGAALAYFFDPQNGKRRRTTARDRVLAKLRQGSRHAARAGKGVAADASAVKQKAMHRNEQSKSYDDQTLKAKIESEVFRPADAPKDAIDVNVENGVVYLRGEVERPELIEELEQRVLAVQGVDAVENLLHLPGSRAPMH